MKRGVKEAATVGTKLRIRRLARRALLLLALPAGLAGCASDGYDSSWINTDADTPIRLRGKSVAVFMLSPSDDVRRAIETMMAGEITKLGANGVPGYTLLTPAQMDDKAIAQRLLEKADITGILVVRAVASEERTRYLPGQSYYNGLGYNALWDYWSISGPAFYEPGAYETDNVFNVESLYFSVADDQLLWGGLSHATSGAGVETMMHKLAKGTVAEMRSSGLLGR